MKVFTIEIGTPTFTIESAEEPATVIRNYAFTLEGVAEIGPRGPQGIQGEHSGVGVAVHGLDPDFPRPEGYDVVIWFGFVEPLNKLYPDLLIDFSAALI